MFGIPHSIQNSNVLLPRFTVPNTEIMGITSELKSLCHCYYYGFRDIAELPCFPMQLPEMVQYIEEQLQEIRLTGFAKQESYWDSTMILTMNTFFGRICLSKKSEKFPFEIYLDFDFSRAIQAQVILCRPLGKIQGHHHGKHKDVTEVIDYINMRVLSKYTSLHSQDSDHINSQYVRKEAVIINGLYRLSPPIALSYYDKGTSALVPWARFGYLDQNLHLLNPEAVCSAILQLGATLDTMHRLGITHGDLKLENIVIDGEEENQQNLQYRLVGPCYSLNFAAKPNNDVHLGTKKFWSPELLWESLSNLSGFAKNKDFHTMEKAEVFSFGLLAYQIYYKKPHPYVAISEKHLSESVDIFFGDKSRSTFDESYQQSPDAEIVPDAMGMMILAALALDPTARPTVAELMAMLTQDKIVNQPVNFDRLV